MDLFKDGLVVRKAVAEDFDRLWPLFKESLGTGLVMTRDSLRSNLFGSNSIRANELEPTDPSLELDLDLAQLGMPVCLALVAEIKQDLIGFVIWHCFYTPWMGHLINVDEIYVEESFRRMGVATLILQKLKVIGKEENCVALVYDESRLEAELKGKLAKLGSITVRDEGTDWSVFRIDFKQDS